MDNKYNIYIIHKNYTRDNYYTVEKECINVHVKKICLKVYKNKVVYCETCVYVYVGAVLYIMSCNHPSIHTHGIPDMYVKAYIIRI